MIDKKKGFLVLVILFISLFYPAVVLGQGADEETPTDLVKYESIGMEVNCDDQEECEWEQETVSYCPPGDCTGDCDSQGLPTKPGCRFYLTEVDDWDLDDACISPALPPGYNVNDQYENTETKFSGLRNTIEVGLGALAGFLLGGVYF